jgi:hypothetical protein
VQSQVAPQLSLITLTVMVFSWFMLECNIDSPLDIIIPKKIPPSFLSYWVQQVGTYTDKFDLTNFFLVITV